MQKIFIKFPFFLFFIFNSLCYLTIEKERNSNNGKIPISYWRIVENQEESAGKDVNNNKESPEGEDFGEDRLPTNTVPNFSSIFLDSQNTDITESFERQSVCSQVFNRQGNVITLPNSSTQQLNKERNIVTIQNNTPANPDLNAATRNLIASQSSVIQLQRLQNSMHNLGAPKNQYDLNSSKQDLNDSLLGKRNREGDDPFEQFLNKENNLLRKYLNERGEENTQRAEEAIKKLAAMTNAEEYDEINNNPIKMQEFFKKNGVVIPRKYFRKR